MLVYLYDTTFDGLLTCVYVHYYRKRADKIYPFQNYQNHILDEAVPVKTSKEKADKVHRAIQKQISRLALKHVYHCYLSNHYEKDTYILKFLELGFKLRSKVDKLHTHPMVHPVVTLANRVSFEVHRFLGLLRFQEVGQGLYAKISPDHDISLLLAEHFVDRIKNEKFIIHDNIRNKAVIYNGKSWVISDFNFPGTLPISEKELLFQQLWKGYFDHIAIQERVNKKLQAQFVPYRYRQNLTEFKKRYPNARH